MVQQVGLDKPVASNEGAVQQVDDGDPVHRVEPGSGQPKGLCIVGHGEVGGAVFQSDDIAPAAVVVNHRIAGGQAVVGGKVDAVRTHVQLRSAVRGRGQKPVLGPGGPGGVEFHIRSLGNGIGGAAGQGDGVVVDAHHVVGAPVNQSVDIVLAGIGAGIVVDHRITGGQAMGIIEVDDVMGVEDLTGFGHRDEIVGGTRCLAERNVDIGHTGCGLGLAAGQPEGSG